MNKWQDSACEQDSEYKEPLDFPLKTKQQGNFLYLSLLQHHHSLDHDNFECQDQNISKELIILLYKSLPVYPG